MKHSPIKIIKKLLKLKESYPIREEHYVVWRKSNGERHREKDPAVVWHTGELEWWKNGKRHRDDGPAVILNNGYREYWVEGDYLTKDQFERYKENQKNKIEYTFLSKNNIIT